MIIKSISLNNIRSYNDATIEFEDGINFLSGDIGCGKSSILLAIEFALFGFKRGDLEGFQLLRKGEKEGFVKLILINPKNNEELEIYRKIKISKTQTISQDSGYVKFKENLQELSPQELNAFIFETLNFPKDFLTKDKNLVYRFTIYTPQEQLKEVLFSKEEQRLEIIRKIFRIDKYKQLVTASGFYLSDLKIDKKIIESKLDGFDNINLDLEQIQKSISHFNEKINTIESKEKSVLENKEKLKTVISKLDTNFETYNEKKLLIEKNLSLISQIKLSLKDLEFETEKLKLKQKEFNLESIQKNKKELNKQIELKKIQLLKVQNLKLEFDKIKSNLNTLTIQKEQIQKSLSQLESDQKVLENLNEQFDIILTKCQIKDNEVLINKSSQKLRKAQRIKKKYEDLNQKIIESNLNLENFDKTIKEKQDFISKFESIEDCPTCMQKVDKSHTHKISTSQNKEIEILIENKSNLRVDIKNFKIQAEKLKLELSELETEGQTLTKLQEKENFLKEKFEKETHLEKQKNEIKEKINSVKEFDYQKNLQTTNDKIEELNKKQIEFQNNSKLELELTNSISNLNSQLNKLDLQFKEIENIETSLKQNKDKNEKLSQKILKEPKLLENQKLIQDKLSDIKEKKLNYQEKLELSLDNEKKISNIKTNLKTEFEFKTKELELKLKQKEEFEKSQKLFKSLIKKENFISKKITPIAQNIEKAVFTKYYAQFNEIFEKLFKDLIEDNEIEVRLNELFSIIVEQNGFDIDIKNLSGGEKSSLAIAYRLGLKHIIENNLAGENKLDLLILDEPTDGFSNEQVDRLGNILKNSDLKQTILVSHDEKIESISDNTIKVEKINHESKLI